MSGPTLNVSLANEWQNDYRHVSMPKYSIRTRVVTVATAKHFIIPIETLFV